METLQLKTKKLNPRKLSGDFIDAYSNLTDNISKVNIFANPEAKMVIDDNVDAVDRLLESVNIPEVEYTLESLNQSIMIAKQTIDTNELEILVASIDRGIPVVASTLNTDASSKSSALTVAPSTNGVPTFNPSSVITAKT